MTDILEVYSEHDSLSHSDRSLSNYSGADGSEPSMYGSADNVGDSDVSATEHNQETQDITKEDVEEVEDKRNPQYIPKTGNFYEHDNRSGGNGGVVADRGRGSRSFGGGKGRARGRGARVNDDCWHHDRFDADEQAPKSRQELIDSYGYDIRGEEVAPRSRRRRRYGRGPVKYTRQWEDETAYDRTRGRGRGRSQRRTTTRVFSSSTRDDTEHIHRNMASEFPQLGAGTTPVGTVHSAATDTTNTQSTGDAVSDCTRVISSDDWSSEMRPHAERSIQSHKIQEPIPNHITKDRLSTSPSEGARSQNDQFANRPKRYSSQRQRGSQLVVESRGQPVVGSSGHAGLLVPDSAQMNEGMVASVAAPAVPHTPQHHTLVESVYFDTDSSPYTTMTAIPGPLYPDPGPQAFIPTPVYDASQPPPIVATVPPSFVPPPAQQSAMTATPYGVVASDPSSESMVSMVESGGVTYYNMRSQQQTLSSLPNSQPVLHTSLPPPLPHSTAPPALLYRHRATAAIPIVMPSSTQPPSCPIQHHIQPHDTAATTGSSDNDSRQHHTAVTSGSSDNDSRQHDAAVTSGSSDNDSRKHDTAVTSGSSDNDSRQHDTAVTSGSSDNDSRQHDMAVATGSSDNDSRQHDTAATTGSSDNDSRQHDTAVTSGSSDNDSRQHDTTVTTGSSDNDSRQHDTAVATGSSDNDSRQHETSVTTENSNSESGGGSMTEMMCRLSCEEHITDGNVVENMDVNTTNKSDNGIVSDNDRNRYSSEAVVDDFEVSIAEIVSVEKSAESTSRGCTAAVASECLEPVVGGSGGRLPPAVCVTARDTAAFAAGDSSQSQSDNEFNTPLSGNSAPESPHHVGCEAATDKSEEEQIDSISCDNKIQQREAKCPSNRSSSPDPTTQAVDESGAAHQ